MRKDLLASYCKEEVYLPPRYTAKVANLQSQVITYSSYRLFAEMVVLMQHKFTKHRLNNGCASSERICFAAYANDSKKHAIKSIITKIKN